MKLRDVVDEKVNNYLKTRRDAGREYTREIIKILLDHRKDNKNGWVRAKDIRVKFNDIRVKFKDGKWCKCSDQTLFRLLNDLTSEHIIEKWEMNGNATFYRIPNMYPSAYFLSRQELIDHLKKNSDGIAELAGKLMIAKEYLKELGVIDPDKEVDARYKSWEINREFLYKCAIKKGLDEGTISKDIVIVDPDDNVATNWFL